MGDEVRQHKPFSSPAEEALWGLQRTADVVRRQFAELVEAAGISLQQYNVLRSLRGADAAGIPTLEIAERMIEKTPGITRLLDKLEAKQLVRRRRSPGDRGRRCAGSVIPASACWLNSTNVFSTPKAKPWQRSRHWN